MIILKDLNLEDITDNYNVIISRKNFYGQPIDSDIKQYEESRKLTKGQGEVDSTRCLSKIIID